MTLYTVRVWTPGYSPESDDEWTTDDLTTARSVLASEIERDWDADAESSFSDLADDSGETSEDIDARYLPAHTLVNLCAPDESLYVPAPAWQTHGLGRRYAIVTVEG